jgi:ABC-2 type transport system ATP-binding protein
MKKELAIQTQDLTKKFKDLAALNKVSLEIKKGEIFGLLGPNGAGKTTLINILSTLISPTSGSAIVNKHNVKKQPKKVRSSIGIVFQETVIEEEFNALENLDLHGRLYKIPKEERKKRIQELIELVELKDSTKKKVETFSGGMKRKLEIARGLMHNPTILFLDEPTLGLDPQIRRNIWNYIQGLRRKENVTIFLTTHYMEEADFLCDRVAIIDKGKIIVQDKPEKLKSKLKGDVITIKLKNNHLETSQILKKAKSVSKFEIVEDKAIIYTTHAEKKLAKILSDIEKHRGKVQEIAMHKPTLEDVFMHHTGKELKDD